VWFSPAIRGSPTSPLFKDFSETSLGITLEKGVVVDAECKKEVL